MQYNCIPRYDKRIKPPVEGSLRVNVSVVLLSLSSPDESSLHYEVEFLMHQRWFDPRMIHDDGDRYAYLNGIHHHADIWKPDIYFIKHGTFKVILNCILEHILFPPPGEPEPQQHSAEDPP